MGSLERCKEMLMQQHGVEGVKIYPDGFVRGRFSNRTSPEKPHNIVVHPLEEELVIKVVVPHIARVKTGSSLYRFLSHLTYDLLLGKVGVDPDGEVRVDVSHACRDTTDVDPSPEVFARLVEVAMDVTNHTLLLATHAGMVEAGVPKDAALKFVEQLREQGTQEIDDEETL